MVTQITVFLENDKGRLLALTRCLADAGIDLRALTLAEAPEYGLARIICRDPEGALETLREHDFRATASKVSAIEVPNSAGGLAGLLSALDELGLNIEYGYCFSQGEDVAVDVFKIRDAGKAAAATFRLEEAGFRVLGQEEM